VLGAETVIGPIIKLVVTVAILAAVGIFIVKPILDTTENISRNVNESVRNSIQDSIHSTQQQTADAQSLSDRLATQSYVSALQGQWPAAAREVKGCLAHANSSAELHQCRTVGERLTQTVLVDYLYAQSYADSLDSQGDAAKADRVRACVKRAGFATAPMRRCRNLAHDLVFG
jgi:hypothetical protein